LKRRATERFDAPVSAADRAFRTDSTNKQNRMILENSGNPARFLLELPADPYDISVPTPREGCAE
jgi:hypothetical protein